MTLRMNKSGLLFGYVEKPQQSYWSDVVGSAIVICGNRRFILNKPVLRAASSRDDAFIRDANKGSGSVITDKVFWVIKAEDASQDMQVVVGRMTLLWNGAWLGERDVPCVWRNGRGSILPTLSGPAGKADLRDASLIELSPSGKIYGCLGNTSEVSDIEPGYSDGPHICEWHGDSVEDLGKGALIGVTDTGTVYGSGNAGAFKVHNGVRMPVSGYVSSVLNHRWIVTATKRDPTLAGCTVSDGSKTLHFDFAPTACNARGEFIGLRTCYQPEENTTCILYANGRQQEILPYVDGLPKGYALESVDSIGDQGEILSTVSKGSLHSPCLLIPDFRRARKHGHGR